MISRFICVDEWFKKEEVDVNLSQGVYEMPYQIDLS